MASRKNQRDLSVRLRSCLIWLLCFSTWRAPVPVLHYHSEDAVAVAAEAIDSDTARQLLVHIEQFHRSVEEAHSQWHVHFVLPSPGPCDQRPDSTPAQPLHIPTADQSYLGELALDNPTLSDNSSPIDASAIPSVGKDAPRLIPLAPPRVRPKRFSPVLAHFVARC